MIKFEAPSDEQMQALRDEHGEDMREVEDNGRMFVLAKPKNPRAHVERFTTTASNDRKKLEAAETLVKQCCVWPDKETFKNVLADEPGLAISLADPATELLGIRQLSVKK
jgi:hypothetical protein